MSDIERIINPMEDTQNKKEKVEVEANGQLRILFDEDIDDKNEVAEEVVEEVGDIPSEPENEKKVGVKKAETEEDKDPNQDELYKFDPEKEHYRDR